MLQIGSKRIFTQFDGLKEERERVKNKDYFILILDIIRSYFPPIMW